MKFVSLVTQLLGKTRRAVAQPASVQDPDVKDPAKIGEALRQLTARLNKLEAAAQPEPTEFEVDLLDTGALVELPHGFKTRQVRWSVVGWFCRVGGVSPTQPPNLVYDGSSSPTSLFLRSYVAGRAIVRVEPSQSFLDTGNTLDLTDTQAFPRNPFGTQRKRVTVVGTASTVLMTVPIPDNSLCVFRTKVIGKNRTTLATNIREIAIWSVYRDNAGAPTNLTVTVQHTLVVAGMTYTFPVVGNDLVLSVQCTTLAQTVDWTVAVEPIHIYLRDEP